jgi:ribosomal protein L11 methyltransferase
VTDPHVSWVKVLLEVPAPAVTRVEALLSVLGAVSVSLEDAHDQMLLEPGPGEMPLWQDVVVSGLFPVSPDPRELLAAAADHWRDAAGFALPEPRYLPLADEDWTAAWRQFATALSFAGRLHLVPVAEDGEPVLAPVPDDGGAQVRLAPGLAFGTGGHPTTRLCLARLAADPPVAQRVVDFGCGSGVLALAALALGANTVLAVDHDPQALAATRDNAILNACSARLTLHEALDADARCDTLVANVLAGPLVELAPRLAATISPDGRVILSGILPAQADAVCAAWRAFDLHRHEEDGWICLDGRRREVS